MPETLSLVKLKITKAFFYGDLDEFQSKMLIISGDSISDTASAASKYNGGLANLKSISNIHFLSC